MGAPIDARHPHRSFVLVICTAVLLITALNAIECTAWALAYFLLGALPNARDAMLYSLSAMTAYGHEIFRLASYWQMMGALEALNGLILFGLTTAFLYSMIQRVWPIIGTVQRHRQHRAGLASAISNAGAR